MSTNPASTAGYASEVDALFKRYEARDATAVHAPWSHFFPESPAHILDIGAGTGRDAAMFAALGHTVTAVEPVDVLRTRAAELHPEPQITWLADALPNLTETRALNQAFNAILMHAVWMHLTEAERATAMPHLAALMAPGARLLMSLRHGPVPAGRRMFDVSGEETIALASSVSLNCLYHDRSGSIQAENRVQNIEWTKLVFEKA